MNALAVTPTLFSKETCFSFYFSTGILIAKKNLFKSPVPLGCGGGSLFFVSTLHNKIQKFGIKLMIMNKNQISHQKITKLASVVQRLDSAIQLINHYPVDK